MTETQYNEYLMRLAQAEAAGCLEKEQAAVMKETGGWLPGRLIAEHQHGDPRDGRAGHD